MQNELTSLQREALALVREHGSVYAAARATGIPRETLRARVDRVRLLCPDLLPPASISGGWASEGEGAEPLPPPAPAGSKADEILRPELLDGKEPVEDWLRRRSDFFKRRRDAEDSRRWMRFTVQRPGPFALAFVGDPHIDDDGCNMPALLRDLDLVERTPAMYGVGLGDYLNNWTGTLRRLYADQETSESQAYRAVEWLLTRPIWLLLLKGNHCAWSGGASPMKWMMTTAPVEEWQARFIVADASGEAEWKVWAAHDFPGKSIYNKSHGPLRRALLTGAEADLYIAGDKHCWSLMEDQEEHSQRSFWAGRARGYKEMDAFGTQLGFGSQDRGQTITAVCDPADRRMQCFSSLEHAAEYLTWLRAKRGFRERVRVPVRTGP